MIWPMAPNLGFASELGFQCLSPFGVSGFFFWRSRVFRI